MKYTNDTWDFSVGKRKKEKERQFQLYGQILRDITTGCSKKLSIFNFILYCKVTSILFLCLGTKNTVFLILNIIIFS